MKGKVKIELRDKNGNIVHSQEKNNLVTNFLNDMFVPMAYSKSFTGKGVSDAWYYSSNHHLVSSRADLVMFDTIQLLGDELTEDADDYFFGDQTVVGLSRYDLGYTGENGLYGSFNGAESGWSEDNTQYTYVYDFATSAANDVEIKSIALSPIWSCDTGCGVETKDTSVIPSLIGNTYTALGAIYDNSSFRYSSCYPICFDYTNNIMYSISSRILYKSDITDGDTYPTFSIKKVLCPLSKFFRGRYKHPSYNSRSVGDLLLDTINLTIKNDVLTSTDTSSSTNYNYGFINYNNGKIYCLITKSETMASGSSLIITVYDIESGEESFITFTNNTDQAILFNVACDWENRVTYVADDKLLVRGYYKSDSTSYFTPFIIDLNTGACTQLKYKSGDLIESSTTNMTYRYYYNGHVLMYWEQYYTVNLETGEVRKISNNSFYGGYPFIDLPQIAAYNSYTGYMFSAYPLAGLVFSTKFNLAESFIKTNEQTLKVTYTLTFED